MAVGESKGAARYPDSPPIERAPAAFWALAHAQVVPTTVIGEADINAWSKETDITIRLAQAMAAACKAEPSLNAWCNAEASERRLLSRVDVGIAVDLEGGLLVPVLRNVGERDSADLRTGLNRLRADAAARSIPPEELRGATITLSNFGMIGGRFASLVVVPPQVAIIGAGRAERRVVVNNGRATDRAFAGGLDKTETLLKNVRTSRPTRGPSGHWQDGRKREMAFLP